MNSYKKICDLSGKKKLVLKDGELGVAFGKKDADYPDYGMKVTPAYFCRVEHILEALAGKPDSRSPFIISKNLFGGGCYVVPTIGRENGISLTKEDIVAIKNEYGIHAHQTTDVPVAIEA